MLPHGARDPGGFDPDYGCDLNGVCTFALVPCRFTPSALCRVVD